MITALLTSIMTSVILVTSPIPSPKPIHELGIAQVLPDSNFIQHKVEEAETLQTIAAKFYGEEAYWTTVWKDNSEIKDPFSLEQDKVLKIRTKVPNMPEELPSELTERMNVRVEEQIAFTYAQVTEISTPSAGINPTVTPVAAISSNGPKTLTEEQITYLGNCEAGMNPAKNTGNGYYGAFQFSEGTWNRMNTGYARADQAPIEVQKQAVQQLVQRSSIHSQFPACAQKMRNSGLI